MTLISLKNHAGTSLQSNSFKAALMNRLEFALRKLFITYSTMIDDI